MLIFNICYLKFSMTAFFRKRGIQVFLYLYLAARNHKYSPTTLLPTTSPPPTLNRPPPHAGINPTFVP